MVELAGTLGTLHALTIGKQADFDRIRDALGPRRAPDIDRIAALGPGLKETINSLGLAAPTGLDEELEGLATALQNPGPFLAFTHGDPCPDNWLRVDGKLRLLDFEHARYRHALLDGVYGRIHFPTCWCVNRTPAHLPARMEAAYRAELQNGCPEAADDTLFGHAVVVACAFWAIGMCQWITERQRRDEPRSRGWLSRLLSLEWLRQRRTRDRPTTLMERDHEWGISTVRQRVLLRSDILARTTQEFGYLEAIGTTFAALAARLRAVWPPEADAMPLFPAFRER
jgi:hypothetical protein